MPKPNYAFEKRQRERAKKMKKEEKAARKAQHRTDGEAPEGEDQTPTDSAGAPAADAGTAASPGREGGTS